MAQTTKAAIDALISTNLADNNTEDITPLDVRQVESAMSDSYQIRSVEVTGNITALIDGDYINTATATYTNPTTPVQGKGFTVTVRYGTATVGGVAYAIAGTVIKRIFHSGTWANYPTFPNNVYAVAGLTVDNTNPRTPTIYPVYSFLATAPTVDEDSSFGYLVGSRVIAQDTQIEYLCTDNTDEDAVWKATSGSWSPTITFDGTVVTGGALAYANFSLVGNVLTYSILLDSLTYAFGGLAGNEGFVQISDSEFPFLPLEDSHVVTANLYNNDSIGIVSSSSSNLRVTMVNESDANAGGKMSIVGQCLVTI
jgi:hypothetical protein